MNVLSQFPELQSLFHHPLFSVGVTLAAYQLAVLAFQRLRWLILQPVLVATLVIIGILLVCGVDYPTYQSGTQMLWLLLGPATVALAIPLYLNLARIRELLAPVLIALLAGCVVTVGLTLLFAYWLGANHAILMSLAPKSVTSPIAILLAEELGGSAALAALFVMFTGVLGAALGPFLLTFFKISHPAVRGFVLGMTAHAIGTAHALQESKEAGAFAALGMSLTGLLMALTLPLLLG